MLPRASELPKWKYFPLILVLYAGYLVIIFLLAIPYFPEIFIRETSIGIMNTGLFLIFGGAAIGPAFLVYLVLEFNQLIAIFLAPLQALNRQILLYTTLYLFLQFILNVLLAISLIAIKNNAFDLRTYSAVDSVVILGMSFVFCLITVILDCYLGWKWVKNRLEKPSSLHWFVGYTVYFLSVGLCAIAVQILNPTVLGILLWPLTGMAVIGAFNLFIVAMSLFVAGLEVVSSTMLSSESDAIIGFVFMTGILFIFTTLILPFFYAGIFYIGVKLAERSTRTNTNLIGHSA